MADGSWTEAHVRRLFWRAGFGATPEEAARYAAAGRAAAIRALLDAPPGRLVGPEPRNEGRPLDPGNEWGDDGLWWLDRMVRTTNPLEEKLALFWFDHFAVTDTDTPLVLRHIEALRRNALGSFPALLRTVTEQPAMLLFLSLANSDPRNPNENFARELMELFVLGAGYTERDVREAARALTGWKADWRDGRVQRVHYSRTDRDRGTKRILGRKGRWDYRDVLRIVVEHPRHAPFLVGKLWDFFVARPLDTPTRKRLTRAYLASDRRIRPVVARILAHPALYADLDAPDLVKAPAVWLAGALRGMGRPVDAGSWSWLMPQMGQELFRPPSVAGWEWGTAWLTTNTVRARFLAATYLLGDGPAKVEDGASHPDWTGEQHLERALVAVGRPWTSAHTRERLLAMANDILGSREPWHRQAGADHVQRALRHLLLSGPDAHVH